MSSASVVVLITGANSGIGLATAGVLAQASSNYHIIIASRNAGNGEQAVKEVLALDGVKGSVSSVQLDVTKPESVSRAVEEVDQKFGRLDVLVNNAGAGSSSSDLTTQVEDLLSVNVVGPVRVREMFMPLLQKSKAAKAIYISSGLGSISIALDPDHKDYAVPYTAYRISKAALNMLAATDMKQAADTGVRTFVMCPGLVRSNLRGKSEEQVSAGGAAGDPRESGRLVLDIVEGRRDADANKFIHKDGVYTW